MAVVVSTSLVAIIVTVHRTLPVETVKVSISTAHFKKRTKQNKKKTNKKTNKKQKNPKNKQTNKQTNKSKTLKSFSIKHTDIT